MKHFIIGSIAGIPAGILVYLLTGSHIYNFLASFLVSYIVIAAMKE